MSPSSSIVDGTSSSTPLSLRVKGGKPFSVFSKLTDQESLTRTWKVSSQIANELEHGHRIENLSWRLWHLRDVLVSSEQRTKGEDTFSTITNSVSSRLEKDKKRVISDLKTPIFRWTDQNDAIRHLGVLRLQRRDEARKAADKADRTVVTRSNGKDKKQTTSAETSSRHHLSPTSSSVNAKAGPDDAAVVIDKTTMGKEDESVKRMKGKGRGTDPDLPSSDDSGSSSSSSTSASYFRLRRRQQKLKRTQKTSSQSGSPPVCWRLTKAEAERRQRKVEQQGESIPESSTRKDSRQASPDPVVSTTWTVEDIEAAEKELREQGVELSGPFLAMLADLKRGELSRVKKEVIPWSADAQDAATAALRQIIQADQLLAAAGKPIPDLQHQQYPHDYHHSQNPTAPLQQSYLPSLRPHLHSLDVARPNHIQAPASIPLQTSPVNVEQQALYASSMPATPAGTAATPGGYPSTQEQLYGWTPLQQPVLRPHHHRHTSSLSEATAATDTKQEKADNAKVKAEGDARTGFKPQCVNCGATSTPLWRRDSNFELQCNACGLYRKLHNAPRPRDFKQRRNDKRGREVSPSGSDARDSQAGARSPHRRSSTASSTKDEWIGIHSGSICANCGTSTTPLWRKDADSRIICNACGLYYKLHNAHRPVTMRMDAIKRRSRQEDRARKSNKRGESAATPAESAVFDFSSVLGSEAAAAVGSGVSGGPLQQTHSHLLNNDSLASASPLSAIHIPSDLWENQLCPMGAWGENCCQNLPQPDAQHHHHHQHQFGSSTIAGDQTLQAVDHTTMDSILGSDWLMNYPGQSPGSTATPSVPSTVLAPVASLQFDPTSVHGSAQETVVGPTYSLKKRQFTLATSGSSTATSPPSWWPFDAQLQPQSQSVDTPPKAAGDL